MSTAAKTNPVKDPVIAEVIGRLRAMYGKRIKRLVLFGSRARGDHRPDSDYDIAVFLRDYDGTLEEAIRLADLGYDLMMERDWDISAKPFTLSEWRRDTLFMRHLRRDGIEL